MRDMLTDLGGLKGGLKGLGKGDGFEVRGKAGLDWVRMRVGDKTEIKGEG